MNRRNQIENISTKFTRWVGSVDSIVVHTAFFIGIFFLLFWGVHLDAILLVLTTAVSLEAIYLAIFIQMTVNKSVETIAEVGEDIEEIQDDVQEIQEDVGEIQGNVKELEGDLEDISEDIDKIQEDEEKESAEQITLEEIQKGLEKLLADIDALKRGQEKSGPG